MGNENIGDAGKNLNGTYATSSMNKKPDIEHLKQYDEYKSEAKNPILFIMAFVDILLLALDVYLFYSEHWIWGIVISIVLVFLLLITFSVSRAVLTKEIAYEDGLLIPAILVNTNPLELVALADMSTQEGQDPIYGCVKMKLNNLPNHQLILNERIPCVSLFGIGGSKGYRKHFEPRPVCWGYQKPEDVVTATKAIQDDEWNILEKTAPKMKDITEYHTPLFFDKNGNIVDL